MSPVDIGYLEQLARETCGLSLRGDKAYFVETRLAPLARRESLPSVAALVEMLREGGDDKLTRAAVEALAVTDTAFFRDGPAFERLRLEVLPALGSAMSDQAVRVWCAGCSTGQEPYSLAMLSEEASPPLRLDIVATDLSERVLEKAQSGLYTQFEVQRGLPIRLLLKHFEKTGEMWSVSPRLRAAVRWRRLNLIEDRRSLRKFDLIVCCNVLTYFEPPRRERVLSQLVASLSPSGYLMLGPDDVGPSGFAAMGDGVFRRSAQGQSAVQAA